MLHQDKAVGEAPHTVAALTLRQRLFKVTVGNMLGLMGELFQRLHGLSHCLITEQKQHEQSETDHNPDCVEQLVVSLEHIACRTHDGDTPTCTLQRTVEDIGVLSVNDGQHHTAMSGYHGLTEAGDVAPYPWVSIREDGLTVQFRCVRMN